MKCTSFIKDTYRCSFRQKLKQLDVEDQLIQISYDMRFNTLPEYSSSSYTQYHTLGASQLQDIERWKPKQIHNLLEICVEESHVYDF